MSSTEAHFDAVSSAEVSGTEVPILMIPILPNLKQWFTWTMLHLEVVFCTGFLLNFITLLACWKASILVKGKPVHLFIFNIMLTDLLSSVVFQFWMVFSYTDVGIAYISGKEWGCLVCQVAMLISLESTFYGILLLTIERLIAIAFPLQHMHRVTKRACRIAIGLAWSFVCGKSFILFVWHKYDPTWKECGPTAYMHPEYLSLYNVLVYTVLASIAILNITIACIIFSSKNTRAAMRSDNQDNKNTKVRSELKMIKMMFTIVFTLFLTWMPQTVIANIVRQQSLQGNVDFNLMIAFHMVRGCLGLGTVADPLLYIWQNPQCRKAVVNLFGFTKKGNHSSTKTNTTTVSGSSIHGHVTSN